LRKEAMLGSSQLQPDESNFQSFNMQSVYRQLKNKPREDQLA
jgi:hypothetical protein